MRGDDIFFSDIPRDKTRLVSSCKKLARCDKLKFYSKRTLLSGGEHVRCSPAALIQIKM